MAGVSKKPDEVLMIGCVLDDLVVYILEGIVLDIILVKTLSEIRRSGSILRFLWSRDKEATRLFYAETEYVALLKRHTCRDLMWMPGVDQRRRCLEGF